MRFARVEDGAIVESGNRLPSGSRLPNGAWLTPFNREWSAEQMAAVGWFDVVQVGKPEGYADSSVVLVEGVPSVVWVSRDANRGELAELAARVEAEAAVLAKEAVKVEAVQGLALVAAGDNKAMAALAASMIALIGVLGDDG
jgi:hypothetical protein